MCKQTVFHANTGGVLNYDQNYALGNISDGKSEVRNKIIVIVHGNGTKGTGEKE